jgi:flagellin
MTPSTRELPGLRITDDPQHPTHGRYVEVRINQNTLAINARNNLSTTEARQAKSLEKLSSGFRINRAGDDAAGLVISEKLRSQVGGLKVAQRNAQDGVSVVQTAEGALTEVHAMLQRVRDLAVQASNDSNNADGRTAIQAEITALSAQVTQIMTNTEFNGQKLFNGTGGASGSFQFQVGANSADTITVSFANLASSVGAVLASVNVGTTAASANGQIAGIDSLIQSVSTERGNLGAVQNRLEHTIRNIAVTAENLTASESRIRDTDMAAEMMEFTRNQILSQAGTAMLAQANQVPQNILSLLR